MNKETLERIKKQYKRIEPPLSLQENGWDSLFARIEKRKAGIFVSIWINKVYFALVLAAAFLFGMFGTLKIVEAAMPKTALYPLKRLTEKIVEQATGSNETAIEHRKEEIVNLVEKKERDEEALKETVREYSKTVEEKKEKIEKDEEKKEEKERFEKRLEEHHRDFDEVVKEDPSAEEDLKEALEASEKDDEEEHHEDKEED